ncbi:hypothetical protein FQN54_009117 [Arachnomyces sp. PD_36]|nr:hypothetical protein FQN54_009117 [Arachnomyces sp. PD_36]
MTRRKRPSMPKACNQRGNLSRHAPLNQKAILERASAWVTWIRAGHDITTRDETRVHEVFGLIDDNDKTDPYTVAVRRTHALGGKELAAILALAVGKSAFRDMKKGLKDELPEILAGEKWHQSIDTKEYVRRYENRQASKDDDSCSNLSETASVVTGISAASDDIELPGPSELTPSQPATISFTSQSQYQAGLTGSVYELIPTDLLELSTALVTQKLSSPGPLLLTEPFHSLGKPFVTVSITNQLCAYLRNQRGRVMWR